MGSEEVDIRDSESPHMPHMWLKKRSALCRCFPTSCLWSFAHIDVFEFLLCVPGYKYSAYIRSHVYVKINFQPVSGEEISEYSIAVLTVTLFR